MSHVPAEERCGASRQDWGVECLWVWRGEEEGGEDGAPAADRGIATAGDGGDGALGAPASRYEWGLPDRLSLAVCDKTPPPITSATN